MVHKNATWMYTKVLIFHHLLKKNECLTCSNDICDSCQSYRLFLPLTSYFKLTINFSNDQFDSVIYSTQSLFAYCIWVYVVKSYRRLYLSNICMAISGRVFKILGNNTLNKLIIFVACIYYPWDMLWLEEIWLMYIFVYLDTYWCKLSLDK